MQKHIITYKNNNGAVSFILLFGGAIEVNGCANPFTGSTKFHGTGRLNMDSSHLRLCPVEVSVPS